MEKQNFTELYNEQDLKVLKLAEDSLNPRINRVHEIIAYASEAKISKIGIANCISFSKEADQLEGILQNAGFEVEKVHCKYGKVPFNDLLPGYRGTSCNPAGQAKYLEEKDTQLNVMMGLCLGHDIIFNSKSKAPVTPLIVKDRKTKHKTIQVFDQNDTK
jgi:uncharacterized metal-binding protein